MALNSEGYSLSDIAAATGNGNSNSGWGGAWGEWILVFLIFAIFGGFGGRNGNGFFGGGSGSGAADNYVLTSDFSQLSRQIDSGFASQERKLDSITNGLCDGFYTQAQLVNGVNTNIMQGNNALATQIADCCCKTQTAIADVNYNIATQANGVSRQIERGFCDTNYNLATQNCATLTAIDKVGDRIIDYLATEKTQALRDENMALRLSASQSAQNAYLINQLKPCPSPAYVVPNPNCCYGQNYAFNSGCGCGA